MSLILHASDKKICQDKKYVDPSKDIFLLDEKIYYHLFALRKN